MRNPSDSPQNAIKKVLSAESFVMKHGSKISSHEECTPKEILLSMREVIHQNTVNLLRRIRNQLKEFSTFVEDIQRNTPSEKQPFASFSFPKPTRDSSSRTLQPVDPRPKNAPLRDALQIVRNLLSRITKVIDQVAADIPAEDVQSRDWQSPDFNYYYTQYVFQMMDCILQTIGKEISQFCELLAEVSIDDILNKLPSKVDEVDVSLSNHSSLPRRSKSFLNTESSQSSSRTGSEESSSSTDDSLSKLKNQGLEALELLTFLSQKILVYFQEKGFSEMHEIHQREFSKRALGVPDLCKNCSKRVARKLRRYTSRENLFAEKYEKSSDKSLSSSDFSQSCQVRHAFCSADSRGSRLSDSKVLEMQRALDSQRSTTSRTYLDLISTHISDAEIKMTYQHPLKSPGHRAPLIGGQSEKLSGTKHMTGLDDTVEAVTKDPGKAEKIEFGDQSDKIHFNLQKFCSLLREQIRKILFAERKSDTSQSETTESHVISNILIRCFREASQNADEHITQSSVRFGVTAHSTGEADVQKSASNPNPDEKEVKKHEKQRDESLMKFVMDSYQLAVSSLEKKRSGGSLEG